jgi:hypothetical protein
VLYHIKRGLLGRYDMTTFDAGAFENPCGGRMDHLLQIGIGDDLVG